MYKTTIHQRKPMGHAPENITASSGPLFAEDPMDFRVIYIRRTVHRIANAGTGKPGFFSPMHPYFSAKRDNRHPDNRAAFASLWQHSDTSSAAGCQHHNRATVHWRVPEAGKSHVDLHQKGFEQIPGISGTKLAFVSQAAVFLRFLMERR